MTDDTGQMPASRRVMSVDALRGFTMFWIIGGGAVLLALAKAWPGPVTDVLKKQLHHAQWEGLYAWDLIWPTFLFVVGVAMPFSFGKRMAAGEDKRAIYWHVARRVVILWVLGMAVDDGLLEYDLSKLSVYGGTLHTIAVGYLIAAVILLNLSVVWQATLTAGGLVLYWLLMMYVPAPGIDAGVMTPDGNLAVYIEKLVLGDFRFGGNYVYVLPSMIFGSMVMFGVLAGQLLRSPARPAWKLLALIGTGVGCLVLGLAWSHWFPVIKQIKTSSFVLLAVGCSYLLLALFYLLADIWGLRKCVFIFVVIGMNPITAYAATRLFDFRQVGNIFVGGVAERLGPWNGLVQATAAFAVVWLLLYWMYRTKTFVKI